MTLTEAASLRVGDAVEFDLPAEGGHQAETVRAVVFLIDPLCIDTETDGPLMVTLDGLPALRRRNLLAN